MQKIFNNCGMECADPMLEYCLLNYWTRLARIKETSINHNKSNQRILETDFEFTRLNGLGKPFDGKSNLRRFGISEYYQYSIFENTFQCHCTLKTERVPFRIDNGCKFW